MAHIVLSHSPDGSQTDKKYQRRCLCELCGLISLSLHLSVLLGVYREREQHQALLIIPYLRHGIVTPCLLYQCFGIGVSFECKEGV